MEEWDEACEEEREDGRTSSEIEASLDLASEGGDSGRQHREQQQARFERAMAKGHVVKAVALLLAGAQGHLRLLGEKHQEIFHTGLSRLLGPAVRAPASRLVRRLLELGVSPAGKHKIFGALIHGAVGSADILGQLLSNDAVDKNEIDHEGNSPLVLAVCEGHAPSVELLLTAGVDSGVRVETELDYVYDDAERTDD